MAQINPTAAMKAVIAKLADNRTEAERIEDFLTRYGISRSQFDANGGVKTYVNHISQPECLVTYDSSTASHTVQVRANGQIQLNFILQKYPACCGAYMLHHFSYNHPFWHKIVDIFNEFMDSVWGLLQEEMYFRNRRIITVMIESSYGRTLTEDQQENRAEIEPSKKPKLTYPLYWDYWHSKGTVRDRLMYNRNSGNILHDLEVVLN